jgi:hypothetical protein
MIPMLKGIGRGRHTILRERELNLVMSEILWLCNTEGLEGYKNFKKIPLLILYWQEYEIGGRTQAEARIAKGLKASGLSEFQNTNGRTSRLVRTFLFRAPKDRDLFSKLMFPINSQEERFP